MWQRIELYYISQELYYTFSVTKTTKGCNLASCNVAAGGLRVEPSIVVEKCFRNVLWHFPISPLTVEMNLEIFEIPQIEHKSN